MFCVYENGAVTKTFNGEIKIPDVGTMPKAWLLKAIPDGRVANLGIYFFQDNSNRFDKKLFDRGPVVDTLVGDTVTRSTTPVPKSVDIVKAQVKKEINIERGRRAHAGLVFSTKNFATDATTIESVNLITTALLDGATFPGGTLKWDDMDGNTFNATEAQFKALRNAMATHFVLCTKQARVHMDAVDALTTYQEVVDYDYSTGWPVNPDASI